MVFDLFGMTCSALDRWMDAGASSKQISLGGDTVVLVEIAVSSRIQDRMASK